MYILRLKNLTGQLVDVCQSDSVVKLRGFIDKEKVPEYEVVGGFLKYYRRGPLEWFKPAEAEAIYWSAKQRDDLPFVDKYVESVDYMNEWKQLSFQDYIEESV